MIRYVRLLGVARNQARFSALFRRVVSPALIPDYSGVKSSQIPPSLATESAPDAAGRIKSQAGCRSPLLAESSSPRRKKK